MWVADSTQKCGDKKSPICEDRARKAPPKEETEGAWRLARQWCQGDSRYGVFLRAFIASQAQSWSSFSANFALLVLLA
jgi:hypothetical protein